MGVASPGRAGEEAVAARLGLCCPLLRWHGFLCTSTLPSPPPSCLGMETYWPVLTWTCKCKGLLGKTVLRKKDVGRLTFLVSKLTTKLSGQDCGAGTRIDLGLRNGVQQPGQTPHGPQCSARTSRPPCGGERRLCNTHCWEDQHGPVLTPHAPEPTAEDTFRTLARQLAS